MSFVTTQPEALASAASSLAGIGSAMNAGERGRAASPTTGVVPAAADEVSALTAGAVRAHAQMYQAVAAQAAAIHEQFVATLGVSSASYAATEAANAAARGRRWGIVAILGRFRRKSTRGGCMWGRARARCWPRLKPGTRWRRNCS